MDDDWVARILDAFEGIDDVHAIDELARLLSDRFVRYTLYYVTSEPATSLDELADVLAGLEAIEHGAIITPAGHEQIRIQLYHIVLPKLANSGYVRFDRDDLTVERADIPPSISTVLDGIL